MTLRVAYDVSLVAPHFGDEKFGIYRVVDETLRELARRPDVQVAITSVGRWFALPGLPAIDAMARRYAAENGHGVAHDPGRGYGSRLGLGRLYRRHEGLPGLYAVRRWPPGWKWRRRLAPSELFRRAARNFINFDAYPQLDSSRFDVFHSTFTGLPRSRITGRLPRVLTVYDLIPIARPDFVDAKYVRHFKQLIGSVDAKRDWVLAISQFTKDEVCEHTGISPERVFVTPLAAAASFRPEPDPGRVAAVRERYKVPPGSYLLSVATSQPRKNLGHLLRSFFRLLSECPSLDASLVLVGGSGWMTGEIDAAVASASPEHRARVVFTGFVPEEDLSAIYSGAAAFVFPSLYEGFGLPALEAMQCGTPVISSNATSLPEVVGDAALTAGPGDVDAWCDAMSRILSDPGLRERLSQAGLRRAAGFTWARCAEATVAAYRAAVAAGR